MNGKILCKAHIEGKIQEMELTDAEIRNFKECGVQVDLITYFCDGQNDCCKGAVPWNDVNWFNSSIGFCDACHEALYKRINCNDKLYEELYNRCEAGDSQAVDELCSLTAD